MLWYMGMREKDGGIAPSTEFAFQIAEAYPELHINVLDVLTRWPAALCRDARMRLKARATANDQRARIEAIKQGGSHGKERGKTGRGG